jgi:hypothetical protein
METFTTTINDLVISWPVMMGSIAIAFIIGFYKIQFQ